MYKSEVLKHFSADPGGEITHGAVVAVARALGITKAAVSDWNKDEKGPIPEGAAYKLQAITKGKLKVNPRIYAQAKRAGAR